MATDALVSSVPPAPEPGLGLRAALGLTRAEFARMTGMSERTVATWEAGQDIKSVRKIIEVGRLHEELKHAFASPAQFAVWLRGPLEVFAGSSPLQVIERGEIDRVWQLVYFAESGSPG